MALTSIERRELFSACPWIYRLKVSDRCDDYKWSKMPLKAVYSMHGREPTGMEQYRCKNRAWWEFRALKRGTPMPAKDGMYCWMHLIHHAIHYNPEEQRRFDRWYKKWKEKHDLSSL